MSIPRHFSLPWRNDSFNSHPKCIRKRPPRTSSLLSLLVVLRCSPNSINKKKNRGPHRCYRHHQHHHPQAKIILHHHLPSTSPQTNSQSSTKPSPISPLPRCAGPWVRDCSSTIHPDSCRSCNFCRCWNAKHNESKNIGFVTKNEERGKPITKIIRMKSLTMGRQKYLLRQDRNWKKSHPISWITR